MDETAVYLEDPRQVTINESGKRHVILKSTGFASMRVTVFLSITATGRKFPPVLVYKHSNRTDSEKINGCIVLVMKVIG
jgi:hypothetical protein